MSDPARGFTQMLQQDLQTQLNTCLVRFEYDVSRRLGQNTLQKLQKNGLDLLRSGRETLQCLFEELHRAFGLAQGAYSLEFSWDSGRYRNADRPRYVEDGYIKLHLPERQIYRYLLQQKSSYKVMSELLTDHVIRYIEKAYYRIEQHWQAFQSHYMVMDARKPVSAADQSEDWPTKNSTQYSRQHNISLDEGEMTDSVIDDNPTPSDTPPAAMDIPQGVQKATIGDTAAQIAQRHRRIQQLQVIGRAFWQDNFTFALAQLFLDLPGGGQRPPTEFSSSGNAARSFYNSAGQAWAAFPAQARQQIAFAPYYIALMQELESRCNLAQQRQNLLQNLRNLFEQSLTTAKFPLQGLQNRAVADNGTDGNDNEFFYSEYPDIQSSASAGDLPDELAHLCLRYASENYLERAQLELEEKFIALSQRIQRFFSVVRHRTRFKWLQALPFLLQRFVFRSRQYRSKEAQGSSQGASQGALRLEHNAAVDKLLNELGEERGQQHRNYELRLLLEQLRKADIALQYQLQFHANRRHYKLFKELQQLRRQLLGLYYQGARRSEAGIELVAHYRTVHNRRETALRLEQLLQEFRANCRLLNW